MVLLIVTVIILNIALYVIPKRLSKIEMYTTSLFAILLNLNLDIFLDLRYNFYGYFKKGVDYENLVAIFGIYPAVNIIFLNYFPFGKLMKYKILYIAVWSIFALVYEWVALHTKFLYHNEWKLLYSVFAYPILYLCLIGSFLLTRRLVEKQYYPKS